MFESDINMHQLLKPSSREISPLRPLAVCRAVWWVDSPAAPVEKVM